MKIQSILGNIRLEGELGPWNLSVQNKNIETEIEEIRFLLKTSAPAEPPNLKLVWSIPQLDIQTRWHPMCHFNRNIPADWCGPVKSDLASSAPVMQLINLKGENRLLFAFSEAMREIRIKTGVCEETNEIACSIELFSIPEAPMNSYEAVLRIDRRRIFYADAIRAASDWFAAMPEYMPSSVPDAAIEPIYSSWYSYHQSVFEKTLEQECAEAKKYGMESIIVDDGWQTDDTNRGYAFCGDWEVSVKRFPDMRAHVKRIHELGMKYILWYSVPFVGINSKVIDRFAGKFLDNNPGMNTYKLDPRFPEVREYLISTYEKAVLEWDLDGFKLDFIDSFHFSGVDPAIKENYAGRDIKSLPFAVDRLLSETMTRLRLLKPEILIEFRQSYIGPAIRKYGNMFRAGDCPADFLSNRIHTIDLRLTSGNTAVHSDMLEWNSGDSPENAALQFLNILFSVPQISVCLNKIPDTHRRMLEFWLNFWKRHKEVLLKGYLKPFHPELNYPIVSVENAIEKIIAVYNFGQYVKIACEVGKTCYVVNASGRSELILDVQTKPFSTEIFDTLGRPVQTPDISMGLSRVRIPASGVLKLSF